MTELAATQQAALAKAAIEFIRARTNHRGEGSEVSRHQLALADEHMYWLVEAVEHGWHPDEFESELPEPPEPEPETCRERAHRIERERRESWLGWI